MQSFILKQLNKIAKRQDKSDKAYLLFIADYQKYARIIRLDVFREGFTISVRLKIVIFISATGFFLLFHTLLIDTKLEQCKVIAYIGLPITVSKHYIILFI